MKIRLTLLCLALCLVLSGCGRENEAAAPSPTIDPMLGQDFSIPEQEREKTNITFMLEGVEETVPAYIYEGMDYTIVVPDGGWHMYEPGSWQATFNQTVKFWIKAYSGDNAKKLVEQLSIDGFTLHVSGSKMSRSLGEDEDKVIENVMLFRNGDSLKAVFYCYPAEGAEGFGVRLDTIVNTFSWKDPQANATSGNMAGLTDAELEEATRSPAPVISTEEGQSPQAAQIALIIASAENRAKELEEILAKDQTQSDMNITSGEIYTVWDDAINAVWKILGENMDAQDFDELLDEQLLWINEKESAVQQAAAEYQGGSMAPLAANQKASEMTRERIYKLAEYIE